ncbi:MAG TPA: diguanylate cyclase [Gammaproteobacteria bacterium]|nr:diguanylate cyclase [Gammaproteobacteria bacterium]
MRRIFAPQCFGLLLVLLASLVILGWLLNLPYLVSPFTDDNNMTFNTALCFLSAGITLSLPINEFKVKKISYLITGGLLLFISSVSLSQYLFNYSFGLDQFFMSKWFPDHNPYPGRMALNTCVIFILTSLVFVLLAFPRSKLNVVIAQSLSLLALLISISILLGYVLDLEVLRSWYQEIGMTTHTAIGFIILSLNLWQLSKAHSFVIYDERSDRQILLSSTIILFSIALIAGLSGFVVSSRQDEAAIKNSIEQLLSDKIKVLEASINKAIKEFDNINKTEGFWNIILNESVNNHQTFIKILLNTTFSGVKLIGSAGQQLYSAGNFTTSPKISIPLAAPYNATLIWENGFRLQLSHPYKQNSIVRRLQLEWSLDEFNRILHVAINQQPILICFANTATIVNCLSTTHIGLPYQFNLKEAAQLKHLMATNTAGFIKKSSEAQKQTFLFFHPLEKQNIGLVIKSDMSRIYQPLRRQLNLVIPILILAISLGAIFLYWQVSPLVKRLHESEAQFRLAFSLSAIGMALITLTGQIAKINPAIIRILGFDQGELLNKDFRDIIYPDELPLLTKNNQLLLENKITQSQFEARFFHKNNYQIWGLLNITLMRDASGHPMYFIAQIQDITQQKKFEEELNYQARYDSLTNLANRTHLEHSLKKLIMIANQNKKPLTLFFIDVDYFKKINDTFGHDAGDKLLITFAERLKSCLSKNDLVGRLGGDEFVLLLNEISCYESAVNFAKKIMGLLACPITIKDHELTVTVSIGISFYPQDGNDHVTLLNNADQALYCAKKGGRNQYRFFKTSFLSIP